MCFGGTSAPQIVYTGPGAQDIERQNEQLQLYMQQSAAQQQQFASSLQQQIDFANSKADQQRALLDQERQAGLADVAAQRQAAYSVTSVESQPAEAQTTQTVEPKKKPNESLKIAAGSVAAMPGSGFNIGV
jgi:hypothetical protein